MSITVSGTCNPAIADALRVLNDPKNQVGLPALPPGATLAQVQQLRSRVNNAQLAAYDQLKSTGDRDWFDRSISVDLALDKLETAMAQTVRLGTSDRRDDWFSCHG